MKSLGIYPGTFDPPTIGHLDVIDRATKMFDRVIVAVGVNSSKKPLLSVDQRVTVLRECVQNFPSVTVESFDGLLVEFARAHGAKSIIRGLRATADFEYEFQMAMVNRRLAPEVDSVFLMTKWEYSYLSSSMVREVALLGGDFRELVPAPVATILREVLNQTNLVPQ